MGIGKSIRKLTDKINKKTTYLALNFGEKKKIKDPRRKKIYDSVNLSDEQQKEIQDFFEENYGKKIDLRWHKLYQSFTGKYDKKYFPEILFSTMLEPRLSNRKIASLFTDKSMVELLYKSIDGLYIPSTTLVCCSGIFYDSDRNVITKEFALEILNNCGKKIIKKTVDTSSGRGVLIVNIENGMDIKNNLTVEKLLEQFGNNFIVQELITNSNDIRKIYNKSLNTIRVITYIVDGKLYHLPLAMRVGQNGNEVDNIHAGGMFIGVSDNGELMDNAFTEFQNIYKEHPDSGVKFKGYKIHGINNVINIAYKCHGRTPHLRMISWDFTIDNNDRVVLIEVNLNGQSIWFPQMANGKSAFGDNTEYMLKLISKKRKKD